MLRCIVKSRGSIVDTEIGACDIPLRNFLDGQLHGPAWHTLQKSGKVRGEVRLQFQLSGGNIVATAGGGRQQLMNAGATLTSPALPERLPSCRGSSACPWFPCWPAASRPR